MTANDRFDRDLKGWLVAEAPGAAPTGLHTAVLDRVRGSRQRPGWFVSLRGRAFGDSATTLDRPRTRLAYVLAILALVLAVVVAAIAVGAFRSDPLRRAGNGAIAYSVSDFSRRDQPDSLHLIDPDGTDQPIGYGTCPTFSRNGTVLAFHTGRAGQTELNVAGPDGSGPRVLRGIGESEYALSPEGTQIAWLKSIGPITSADGLTTIGSRDEIWLTAVSGGPSVRIVPAPDAQNASYGVPSWSPDGRRIAFATYESFATTDGGFSVRSGISVVDKDGSNLGKVTARAGTDQGAISWSPDSRWIAFVGLQDGISLPSLDAAGAQPAVDRLPVDIFVVNVDGTGERVVSDSKHDVTGPDWSPDGKHLAYSEAVGDQGYSIVTVRMDGPTAVGPAIVGPAMAFTWSPDGQQLVLLESFVGDPAVDPSVNPQSLRSRIQTVDAEFRQPPTILESLVYDVRCPPMWQAVEP